MENIVPLSIDVIRITIEKRIAHLKVQLEMEKATSSNLGFRTDGAIEELEFFVKHLPKGDE